MADWAAGPGVWPGKSYVRMAITDFEISLRIGIHAGERQTPQRVLINVEMFADDPGKAPTDGIGSIIDYDVVYNALIAWRDRPHVDLIETLLEELIALCFCDARVQACRVSLMKPDVFAEAASAGVEVFRIRGKD